MDNLLQKIKTSLRIKHSQLDDDVQSTIEACLIDLQLAGIQRIDTEDALIYRAVQLYCKATYGSEFSEKYMESYNMLKISLALAGDYNGATQ